MVVGKNKEFSRIIIIEGFLNIIFLLILVQKLQHIGASISTAFVELFIVLAMLIVIKKEKILVLR